MDSNSSVDSYQEETVTRLKRSKIYNRLLEINTAGNDHGTIKLLSLVNETVHYCYHRSKMVMKHMGEFTLHDGEHLFRVLKIMEHLIPQETLLELSSPELALLIMAIFFHDIGMAPSESEVKCWLGIYENTSPTPEESAEFQKYNRFRSSKQIQVLEIHQLRNEGKNAQADLIEKHLITEFIRITHADRAMDIIDQDWNDKIRYKDVDLTPSLAQLCQSHNYDGSRLLELESSMIVGADQYVCLPFIGVVLRLADVLDFDANRTPSVLYAHLGVKNPVSIQEWQKHRSVEAWTISPSKIIFNATCNHPAIEYSIRAFCDYIDYELVSGTSILNNLHDSIRNPFPNYYKIGLPRRVDRSQIVSKKDVKGNPIYLYRDTKFTLDKEQIIDILMGTKLYGQPNVALRELIQNSIDACKLRVKMEESWGNSGYIPQIEIKFSKEGINTFLEVNDNGVGMDQDIIDRYYSKVGSSYYASSDFIDLKSTLKSTFIPTSRFGIGILSCFMVSNNIEVETKRIYEAHESGPAINLSIVGQESIFYIKAGTRKSPGTATKMLLKNDNPWSHNNDPTLIKFVQTTIPFPPCTIKIITPTQTVLHTAPSPAAVSFGQYSVESSWKPDNKFKSLRIDFDGSQGIYGACEVAILEDQGIPTKSIKRVSEPFSIKGTEVRITTEWTIGINRYSKNSQNVDPESIGGDLKIIDTNTTIRESKAKLALHGVEIPMSLFSQWMGQIYQQAKVNWPICLLLNVDVRGEMDINLNSARTELLMDEKFRNFEKRLASLICEGIRLQVSANYWEVFKNVTLENIRNGVNSTFKDVLETM